GGHAVLPGWLRARAGRVLTAEAAATFCRIAAALGLTLEVQARIAEVGPTAAASIPPARSSRPR
ncbi:MAG TPA: hypothetical protein VFE33_16725, partial [Thermoanaerobaculia bacterium]|nr:hypothetical protein [Thermoanaerobaculia bacterium]